MTVNQKFHANLNETEMHVTVYAVELHGTWMCQSKKKLSIFHWIFSEYNFWKIKLSDYCLVLSIAIPALTGITGALFLVMLCCCIRKCRKRHRRKGRKPNQRPLRVSISMFECLEKQVMTITQSLRITKVVTYVKMNVMKF